LGPGLVAAVQLAARGKRGSKVIICTDGMANSGIGSTGSYPTPKPFYESVGASARKQGISISVISIVDTECRLDLLSPIANLTGGDVIKIDPTNLSETFENIVSNSTLGTNVEIRLFIHQAFNFRNEDQKSLEDFGRILMKSAGNVCLATTLSFEYSLKSSKELSQIKGFELEKLMTIPFQAQIQYTGKDDQRYLKVITCYQPITNDKAEARKNAKLEIVVNHAKVKTAELASKGFLKEAMINAQAYSVLTDDVKGYQKEINSLYSAIQHESQTLKMVPDSQSDNLVMEINQALQGRKK